MTEQEILGVIQQIHFPDWEFAFGRSPSQGMYLRVAFQSPFTARASQRMWYGRKWPLSAFMTKSEVVQTALKAVLTAMEHEVREQFTYRGRAVYQPHHDVEALVKLVDSTRPDVRETV